MKALRWRVRTLAALVVVVALGIKGVQVLTAVPDDPRARREALARLADPPRPADAEARLVAALADPELWPTAAWALDRIGSTSPALIPVMVAELETRTRSEQWSDRMNPYRLAPASTLTRLDLPASTIAPLLRKAMASRDDWIRRDATSVLAHAARKPGPTDPTLASLLVAALDDPEFPTRIEAAGALLLLDAGTRGRAVAALLGQLRREPRPGQLIAVLGLARFDPEGGAAAPILAERLSGGDPKARIGDAYLLGRLGTLAGPAVPALVGAMTAPDAIDHAFNSLQQFRAVGSFSDELDRIIQTGFGDPKGLASAGAWALRQIGPGAVEEAVSLLVGMLGSGDRARRVVAAEALGAMGHDASAAIPLLVELAWREPYESGSFIVDPERGGPTVIRIIRALGKVGTPDDPRSVGELIRLMKTGDTPERRWGAAYMLAHLFQPPPRMAAGAFRDGLKDPDSSIRTSSAIALGQYDGPEGEAAASALVEALGDEDPWTRGYVAGALGALKARADRAVPVLIELLGSEVAGLRGHAAQGLAAFGPSASPAVEALEALRGDPDTFVHQQVGEALKAIGAPKSNP